MKAWMLLCFILVVFSSPVRSWNRREIKTISVDEKIPTHTKWTNWAQTPELSLKKIISVLKRSPTGKDLILSAEKKAWELGSTLFDLISPADGSATDTTLIRRFTPGRLDQVSYHIKGKINLNRDLRVPEAILDLAHELTHFAKRNAFNPYLYIGPDDFIRSTIEGVGGEVEAYIKECQVLSELFPREVHQRFHCQKIWDEKNQFYSRELALWQFYKVGKGHSHFLVELAKEGISPAQFPLLSNSETVFLSSAYGSPYPIAALDEYQNVMSKACANDRKRLDLWQQKRGRFPASDDSISDQQVAQFAKNLKARCR